ncbi:molybdopterin-guanine dinucleotide biosynthesis protein B [Parasalinivibrio latis]|uniref:molybdopterin-guanine dinucleotide biosynthesis protein B n=1 Tax=Parasalinivibrio latis TaxID=2952610 RepID=UPI0030E4721B
MQNRKPVIGFAGFSGSGKTTLIEKVIPLLRTAGVRVAVVKHSHHVIDPDKPGKDSYRLRKAGSDQFLMATRERNILFFEYHDEEREEPTLEECLSQLDHGRIDLVLVEGFRDAPIPKIEIHRPVHGKPLLHPNDRHIIAMASDETIDLPASLTRLDLNQPQQVSDFILSWLQSAS